MSGREMLLHDEPFFEQFDLAITATVAAITTDERSGSSTYGATEIAVDGINAFGVDNVPGSLIVTASDPGWIAGYPFAIGRTYFIPLIAVGPQGQQNHSFLCDPITEIRSSDAARVPALAFGGLAVATPTTTVPDTAATRPRPRSRPQQRR